MSPETDQAMFDWGHVLLPSVQNVLLRTVVQKLEQLQGKVYHRVLSKLFPIRKSHTNR